MRYIKVDFLSKEVTKFIIIKHMRKHGNANAKKYFEATMKISDTWESGTKKVVSENMYVENYTIIVT